MSDEAVEQQSDLPAPAPAPVEDVAVEADAPVLVFDDDVPEEAPAEEVPAEAPEAEETERVTELRVGVTGPEVSAWQEREGLHVTGVFTEREAQYVKNRQQARKNAGEDVVVDGVVKL